MKKRLFLSMAAAIGAVACTVAQNQFYVILKDGSATSFPVDNVDNLTFDTPDGKVIGLQDLLDKYKELEQRVSFIENNCCKPCKSDIDAIWNSDTISAGSLRSALGANQTVDLGLSVKWASYNVGADEPLGRGQYFAWAEIVGNRGNYVDDAYNYALDKDPLFEKGIVNTNWDLTAQYDAATAIWGEEFRMPTPEEVQELIDNSVMKWEVVDLGGGKFVEGILVRSNMNDNLLFLPASGDMSVDHIAYDNEECLYWISRADMYRSMAFCFQANKPWMPGYIPLHPEDGEIYLTQHSRMFGYTIRAVENKKAEIPGITAAQQNVWDKDVFTIDELNAALGSDELVDMGGKVKWAKTNVGAKSVTDGGDFFMWGYTTPSFQINWKEFPANDWDTETLYLEGWTDKNGNLTAEHDAATVNAGSDFHTPTATEFRELLDNSRSKNAIVNLADGSKKTVLLVQSLVNGNVIVFPADGLYGQGQVENTGSLENNAWVWTASFEQKDNNLGSATYLIHNWNLSSAARLEENSRYLLMNIRPVASK